MKFSRSWYWLVFCGFLIAGIVSCRDFPTEPADSTSDEASSASETPSTSDTPSSESQPSESETGKEVTSGDDTGYCDGSELLCLPAMTSEYVAKYKGSVVGGTFSDGQFSPSSTGGIKFPLSVDVSKKLKIEFEIEGNIPNWNKSENNGGKVSLFTMAENSGTYYLSLQRMDREYRGGGLFRVILGDRADMRADGAAWLITHRDLAGQYSMNNWGSEQHQFEVITQGNSARLYIDSYRSRSATAPYTMSGRHNVTFVLGNREPSRIFLGEGALTRFLRLRISYE
ncbi:hypothetical protein U27_05063 [Candidatus Vecturithrix granuli]|uniref:Uncharacterized protein n=1 Tax=Vecturithrix granuli TaxID=1499967 RepID=A0A081C0I5_VECG1|nr:hypothetical protein U27_05063 [Candidatus Vecturithrix granuli]